MINLKQSLVEDIAAGIAAARSAGELPKTKNEAVVVERTEKAEHGDYASPVALTLTKSADKPPLDILDIIARHMPKKEYVGKLEAVAPGFLNIRLNPGWMTARLDDVLEEDICGGVNIGRGKQYNFEFISANPTGPLTLGNARTAFSVDSLANVLTCAGYNVTREYYINDAGGQIMKLGESALRRILEGKGEKVDYPEELYQGEYISEVATILAENAKENEGREFTGGDLKDKKLIEELGQQAADTMMDKIKKTIAEDLRIKFDVWTSERKLRTSGAVEKVHEKLRDKKMIYEKDGAEYLRTTKFGDSEDRIFVKSDGEYAYIAPDVAYHQDKFDRKFDGIFTYVGADHQGHGSKLRAALEALGCDVSKLHVVAAQWIGVLRDGKPVKLSKRRGNLYGPGDLIEEVGYDAARFFMVQHALTTHMDFDINLAKERNERNPVYYAQYAYVRLQSILRRAKELGVIEGAGEKIKLTSHGELTHTTELELMRQMYRLPEAITDIAASGEAQQLAYYALELARAVHVFYRNVPVIAADKEEVRMSRLQLVLAARKVMGQTLDLLGISKPEVM
ncbi:MAG: arginine--tRNA ligase [Candidatus Andersenbacteria bacterium]|nr:arginine--tRNA ligase [bacterium]MDZ4225237.1 arginine--tRNA ligase [Candidatus Andersenbacteria bacterium]